MKVVFTLSGVEGWVAASSRLSCICLRHAQGGDGDGFALAKHICAIGGNDSNKRSYFSEVVLGAFYSSKMCSSWPTFRRFSPLGTFFPRPDK